MSPTRLVLFDIDGTILWGGPLWKECFIGALSACFPSIEFPLVPFCGKTDIQICREVMANNGFSPEQIESNLKQVIDEYLARTQRIVQTRSHEVKLLPGICELIKILDANTDVVLGLLTGNVRDGAYAKLSCVGLAHYFKMGVYGDDHWDRYQLPALAVKRAYKELGLKFSGKQIVIIGDTVHDINCGKSIGARSIAVGTGKESPLEDLMSQNPDYYFKDLSITFDVIAAIMEAL